MTLAKMKAELEIVFSLKALAFISNIFPLLKHIPCIYYPLRFSKNKSKVKALIDSDSEVKVMTLAYVKKPGFWTQKTNVRAEKINRSSLATFKMVIAKFQVSDKLDKTCFFQKTFLFINSNVNIILEIFFLTLSNENILFVD